MLTLTQKRSGLDGVLQWLQNTKGTRRRHDHGAGRLPGHPQPGHRERDRYRHVRPSTSVKTGSGDVTFDGMTGTHRRQHRDRRRSRRRAWTGSVSFNSVSGDLSLADGRSTGSREHPSAARSPPTSTSAERAACGSARSRARVGAQVDHAPCPESTSGRGRAATSTLGAASARGSAVLTATRAPARGHQHHQHDRRRTLRRARRPEGQLVQSRHDACSAGPTPAALTGRRRARPMSPVFGHGAAAALPAEAARGGPRHGYEVIRLLQDRFLGVYSPSPGTIYPRLARLEEEGLVTHEVVKGKKVYRLTDAGRDELERAHGRAGRAGGGAHRVGPRHRPRGAARTSATPYGPCARS